MIYLCASKALQCTRRFGKITLEAKPPLVQFVQVAKALPVEITQVAETAIALPVEITQVAETGLTALFSLPNTLKNENQIKEKLRKSIQLV